MIAVKKNKQQDVNVFSTVFGFYIAHNVRDIGMPKYVLL